MSLNFINDRERLGITAKMRDYTVGFARENGRFPRVFVQTFGCQQNVADSEKLSGMAAEMGYEPSNSPDGADLIVVNTCAIREHAERRTLSIIGQYKHIKEKNPALVIAVCGCMVGQQHRREELKTRYPYVDITFPPASLHLFPGLLAERLAGGRRSFTTDPEQPEITESIPIKRESPYRAWVSVMYGCNNFCSYCIVPYVRGRERSRRPEAVVDEVRGLVADGVKEITLLGQNVNSYGNGCDFGCDFADLLGRLAALDGDFRLAFMTSHPKDATEKLIDTMAQSEKIAHRFHLPLQSGSNAVLERMNRRYTIEKYLEKLAYLRKRMPDAAVSSDIIVGFPGETDEDFEATLAALRAAQYDKIFSFMYSPRKGTPAAEMEGRIPQEVKSERFSRLVALQNEISLEKNRAEVGKRRRVLCDGESHRNPDMREGRTEQDKIVIFSGDTPAGEFVEAEITRADTFGLYGALADKADKKDK